MRFASETSLKLIDRAVRPIAVAAPPSLRTVSLLSALTRVRTATRCGHCVRLEAITWTTGAPNCSPVERTVHVRTAFPLAPIDDVPALVRVSRFTFGRPAY